MWGETHGCRVLNFLLTRGVGCDSLCMLTYGRDWQSARKEDSRRAHKRPEMGRNGDKDVRFMTSEASKSLKINRRSQKRTQNELKMNSKRSAKTCRRCPKKAKTNRESEESHTCVMELTDESGRIPHPNSHAARPRHLAPVQTF